MLFGIPKPTVTPDDKKWTEEAFLWFESQYTREYLKNAPTVEPTKEFFDLDFKGTKENAEALAEIICTLMDIKGVAIDLHYFSDKPLELIEGLMTTQSETGNTFSSRNTLGTYSETGQRKYSIGVELELLKNPVGLIATLAHELSHLVLLGEGRIEENDEVLTDLNCIALGFGIFTCNSIFTFSQWQGASHQGWQAQRQGYVPEEVASYALALLTRYQGKKDPRWVKYLNPSPRKMFKRNMQYLAKTSDPIAFH